MPIRRAAAAIFGDGDLSAPARRSGKDCSTAIVCPAALGAGAPATRRAAAELVDELVEDVGEASSELVLVAAVVGGGFVFVMLQVYRKHAFTQLEPKYGRCCSTPSSAADWLGPWGWGLVVPPPRPTTDPHQG